jgi:hypothetical protein
LKERLNEIIKSLAERRKQIDEFSERLDEAKVIHIDQLKILET